MSRDNGRIPASAPVIVAGVDGSERSLAVLRWADEQALLLGAWLIALTAYGSGLTDPAESPELAAAADRALGSCLDRALSPERAAMAVRWIDAGEPADALTRRRDWRERLVVIGGHHRALLRPLGSVTARVVGHAPAPVAVVRDRPEGSPSGLVVVGVDGSPYARRALQWAAHYAERAGAKLTAVMAYSTTERAHLRGTTGAVDVVELERVLHDELARLSSHHAVPVEGHVWRGQPADVLRDAASVADLLVVGSHGHAPALGRVAGSVSQQLVQHCATPLVVVNSS